MNEFNKFSKEIFIKIIRKEMKNKITECDI